MAKITCALTASQLKELFQYTYKVMSDSLEAAEAFDAELFMKNMFDEIASATNPETAAKFVQQLPTLIYAAAGTNKLVLLKMTTDPIIGIIRSNNPYDAKAKLIQAQLTAIVPNLARGIYGEVGVLTDNDVMLYSQTLPNLKSTEEVRDLILASTVRSVQRSIENKIKVQAGLGRDLSGLTTIYKDIKTLADSLEIKTPSGSGKNDNLSTYLDSIVNKPQEKKSVWNWFTGLFGGKEQKSFIDNVKDLTK